ncbi:MAG: alpha/beta hydrolase [Candidatus Metalachnospira sp.]|nr:alpha/beta hydrolase [Bacteroidaceae bacterium]MEA4973127.1 alpha/beta hydrolase [Candidatus Metalachnospira sp.]
MENNKKIKSTIIVSSILFAPLAINKLMFFVSSKINRFDEAENVYDWRLGKIGYKVKGSGRPLVLIHDSTIGSSSEIWGKNIDELSNNYKVYALDLLGYGTSERVNTAYSAYTFGKLINDFITDVIQKPAAVCAVGEGAMYAAIAYKINPDNFKKFILICPKGISDNIASNDDNKKRKLYELPVIGESIYLIKTSRKAMYEICKEKLKTSEKGISYLADRFYASAHNGGGNNRYVYASYITDFMNMDVKSYIYEINLPVLIIWGEQSVTNPIENMEKLKSIIKRGEFAVFEETADYPNFENPVEFNKTVKGFLK